MSDSILKVFHLADIHADDSKAEQVKRCLAHVVDLVIDEKPDLIIIAGDIFNSRDVKLDSKSAKLVFQNIACLSTFAPIAIDTGTPSHEGHAPEALFFAGNKTHNVHVSTLPETLYLVDGKLTQYLNPSVPDYPDQKPDAIISMVPTPTKQFFDSSLNIEDTDAAISTELSKIFAGLGARASEWKDVPHILVGHFTIRGSQLSNGQQMIGRDIEVGKDQIALSKADLTCLGHIHKAQEFPGNIFYSGSLIRCNFGEIEDKGFWIHEFKVPKNSLESVLNKFDINSEFIFTPADKLVIVREDFTTEDNGLQELDVVLYQLAPDEVEGSDIKIEFTAFQDEANQLDKEKLENFYMSAGAKSVTVNIIRKPRQTVRSENLLNLTSLREKVTEMAILNGEEVKGSVMEKADMLESMTEEEIINQVNDELS